MIVLPRAAVAGIAACFFLSGATGLVYEVLWIRTLSLVFGHTVFAVTTVLAAFMGGLGLGSWIFGRIADRQARPLRLYGLLELGVAVCCLLVPVLLPVVETIYRALARALSLSPWAFGLSQFALVLVLLLPPTTLMGATLPVLSRLFATDSASVGRRVGFLYAANTLGAVLGTGLAGYVLLPSLGMRATLYLAAAVNVVLGGLLVLADRRLVVATPEHVEAAPGAETAPPGRAVRLTTIGLGVAGAVSMIYEVGWTRALSLVIGSSTYAFTAMLLAFLLGLALGSALFSRLVGARTMGPATFGLLQLGVGVAALGVLPLFARLPDVVVRALTISLEPGWVLTVQVTMAIAAMLLPTLLMGAAFPCAVQVAARGPARVGGDVGRLYAINTVGAIFGTVIGGFVLMPLVGAHGALKVGIVVNLGLGLVLLGAGRVGVTGRQGALAAGLAAAIVAGLALMPAWSPSIMTAGPAVYPRVYQRFAGHGGLARATADSQLVFYRDGLTATVSVHREGPTTLLRVNGKTDASNGLDMHTQLMVGHLPLLLHPDARTVMVVGLGSGVTIGAVAAHPVERIDVVEIEPAVVEAARFFEADHRHVLSDPRVSLATGDARNFLVARDRRWDVIVSEPSNPWIGGVATLFTEEFYALARSRLTPGGVMVQWIDGYTIRPDDLKMVVKTFRTAFPATTVWHAQGIADFMLVGSVEARPLDLSRLHAVWSRSPRLQEDFVRLGYRGPWTFLADFLLAEPDTARLTLGADLNTDDRLPLEFSAPKSLHTDTAAANYRMMRAFRTVEVPRLAAASTGLLDTAEIRHDLGRAYLRKDLPTEAAAQFERALRADPRHVPSLVELGRVQLRLNLPLRAIDALQSALRHDPTSAEAHALLARIWQQQQVPDRALQAAEAAVRLAPDTPDHRVQLAGLLEQQGRMLEAVEQYLTARSQRPHDVALMQGLANAYTRLGRSADAVAVLEAAAAVRPDDGLLLHRLGRAYLAVNQPAAAVPALRRAVARAPLLAPAHADLGVAHLGAGEPFKALAALERALAIDPGQTTAAQLVGEINARLYGGKAP